MQSIIAYQTSACQPFCSARFASGALLAQTGQMGNVGKVLRLVRVRKGIALVDMADMIHTDPGNLSRMERDQTEISLRHLARIAKIFDMKISEIIRIAEGNGKDMDEAEILAKIPEVRRLPLIELKDVAAFGLGVFNTVGGKKETIGIDAMSDNLSADAFATIVNDESMTATFQLGDVVVVDPGLSPSPGDYVVAQVAEESTAILRQYKLRGRAGDGSIIFELSPLNNNYPSITVSPENPGRIIGKVVQHRRNFN